MASTRANGILAALIGALALLVVFGPADHDRRTEPPLAEFDSQNVSTIEIHSTEHIRLARVASGWNLTAPFQAPANPHRVRLLLEIPAMPSPDRYPIAPDEYARFGLAPPKAILHLGAWQLDMGGLDPLSPRRYVRVGDLLYLVEDRFERLLLAPATDYVEKRLLPESAKPRRIELPGLTLSQGADGRWQSTPPGGSPAQYLALVENWTYARAVDVRRAPRGMQPKASIRITLTDGQTLVFGVLADAPELIVLRPEWGLSFHFADAATPGLLQLQEVPGPEATP